MLKSLKRRVDNERKFKRVRIVEADMKQFIEDERG